MLTYRIRKNQNQTNESAYGKYYARLTHELMNFDEFVAYMAAHNCVFSEGTIHGVLIEMLRSLRELLLDGKAVRIGDLGIFSIGAATEGTERIDDFGVSQIKGVRVNLNLGKRFRAAQLFADAKFREAASYTGSDVLAIDPEAGGETANTGEGGTGGAAGTGGESGGTGDDSPINI